MSRIEEAEQRLHSAILRLENALASYEERGVLSSESEAKLRERIVETEAERNSIATRMDNVVLKLDKTIERLRNVLRE